MIINEKQNEAQVVGDIQVNRVGIDSSNIDFIATLLTSNLYSQPLASFLRETISNAYDSHIEAGTKEPIILLIDNPNLSSDKMRISIRDFGVGISPERFEHIYKNIGSSTKRESNDFIGMFGIGRFSVLSCANVANITSYYNGKKYSYLMYKNNGGINIDKLDEEQGDFKNGLEVSAEVRTPTLSEFREAINMLSMFRTLHIECKIPLFLRICREFNERKVLRVNNLLFCNILPATYFKVGNVLYPTRIKTVETSGIIIELPMGQVDITPNREDLQYSDFTKRTIDNAVIKVKQTFKDLIQSRIKIASLSDYYNFIEGYSFAVRFEEQQMVLPIRRLDYENFTFDISIEGKTPPKNFNAFLGDIDYIYCDIDNIYKILSTGRRWKNGIAMRNIIIDNDIIATKGDPVTKQVTLEYYRKNLKNKDIIIFTTDGIDKFKEKVVKQLKLRTRSYNIDDCMNFMFEHTSIKSIRNSDVPEEFVTEFKNRFKVSKDKSYKQIFGLRRYDENGFKNIDYTNFDSFLKYEVPTFAVYATNSTEHELFKGIAKIFDNYTASGKNYYDHPRMITVKKTEVDLLKDREKFVHINDFLYICNNFLKKLVTAYIIWKQFDSLFSQVTRYARYKEFTRKYSRQMRALPGCVNNPVFQNIVEYYKSRGWYDKVDVEYFKLTSEDVEMLEQINLLDKYRGEVFQSILYMMFSKNKHLTIDKPDKNIYKIIKEI